MKRFLLSTTIAAAALALAACGSDGAVGSSSTGAPSTGAPAQTATVSIMASGAMGNILVDSSGKALYSPDQEADGTVHCVDACLQIWVPLAPGATAPMAPAGGPTLAVINRPDGTKQVTAAGRPLYTFAEDSQGKVTGDGAADAFGGQNFTWHVVHADGTVGAAPAGSTPPAGTTPATSGGGYGY
jgi:predicted lipoprotein with Yx(FWY)xxD motif